MAQNSNTPLPLGYQIKKLKHSYKGRRFLKSHKEKECLYNLEIEEIISEFGINIKVSMTVTSLVSYKPLSIKNTQPNKL